MRRRRSVRIFSVGTGVGGVGEGGKKCVVGAGGGGRKEKGSGGGGPSSRRVSEGECLGTGDCYGREAAVTGPPLASARLPPAVPAANGRQDASRERSTGCRARFVR
ncbi:hypothetical protein E2C01_099931 [Portunus trituberculatus]|uniref:Uncharacterized protein n=1 Tax=Portunus trituberculatus TaxID=210409 RepID=A0A5B7K6R4_PORTR|nr:hypothetical protein [Portunus trituberculatus]